MTQASSPRHRWLGVVLTCVVAAFIGTRVWLALAFDVRGINDNNLADSLALMTAFSMYFVVGVLLVVRRPDNRLGWVLTAIGVLTTTGVLAESYALLALAVRPSDNLPGAVFAAWIHNWYWLPLLVLLILFVPLLFPTGRPLTPRWNWLYRASVLILSMITLLSWVKPTLTDGNARRPRYSVQNPLGVPAVGDLEQSTHGALLFLIVLLLALCAIASLVVRFRRSRGVERQQMKLFVFAAALIPALVIAEQLGLRRFLPESNAVFAVAVALPPIAIGVAVRRYRLYDIDRIISRTVSYALLTALLLGVYLGAVTALTTVTAPIADNSPLAVAAATLAAVAAFGPARRRIQSLVDRRFNRARYDAARTVDSYRNRIRDEVEIDALGVELVATVQAAMQPSRTLIWMRDGT